jgi:tetratricopeptide (TPR) repeat protein
MTLKHILLASAVLVSVSSFAQKDELKKLKKIYEKETPSAADLADYKATLDKLAPLATEEGDKVYYNYYKVNSAGIELALLGPNPNPAQYAKLFSPKSITELATAYDATLEYEKKSGKKVFTDDINEDVAMLKPILVNVAVNLGEAKKFKEASEVLYAVYLLDKKDKDKLFYAASYAVNGQDFPNALKYYNELKGLNYTGESTIFWATNKTSKKEESFATRAEREIYIKGGTHEKPRDEKGESKRSEIDKNIALILVEQGKIDEAKAAIAEARKTNPENINLILTEADLYLKVKDFDTYTRLVNEAIAKDPTNADLVYNLGVISGNANKVEDAEKYYKKALELNPKYVNAYINLAELKLRVDTKYVDEMSKLGTSEKDNKRYDQLRALQLKNYKEVLPYLEKAVELDEANEPAKKTLLSVYGALEMTDKAKALKAKM